MKKILVFGLVAIFVINCTSEQEKKRNLTVEQANDIFAKAQTTFKIKLEDSEHVTINSDSFRNELIKYSSTNSDSALIIANQFDSIVKLSVEFINKKKEEEKEEAKKKIKSLKTKFHYEKDEFRDIGFYTHKTWGKYWPNRKTLTVGLNSNGYYYLKSNYHSTDWLFHKMIKVKVGEEKYETQVVERYEDNNRSDNSGGKIWEVITYDAERKIIEAIVENVDKKVMVRFIGDEFYDDIVLSKRDKQAIKDTYMLSKYIRLTK